MPRTMYDTISFKSASSVQFIKAIDIYERNIEPSLRTDSNEIAYWIERNKERESGVLYSVGFICNNVIIGYAQFIHFVKERIIFFDYLVLDEHERGQNRYAEFIEQLRYFIDEKGLYHDYILAEVGNMTSSEDPSEEAKDLIRLFKWSNFQVACFKYYQPPLGIDNHESDMPATLLISTKEKTDSIKVKTLLKFIKVIYFDHYIKWYSIYPDTIGKYKQIITKKYEKIEKSLEGQDSIQLNGYRLAERKLSPVKPPYPTNSKYKSLVYVIPIFLMLFLLAVIALFLDKVFNISSEALIRTMVALFFVLFCVFSLFRKKTIQWVEVAMKYLSHFGGK
jgi:hypothetical protein